MRLVFFGTPDFAVPSLEKLLGDDRFQVVGVITQPDARRGRGKTVSASPVKELALQHGLPIYQPERLNKDTSVLQTLEASQADFFVVVAYGQILSPEVLAMPQYGCINVHGSLLPKYRGAAPIQWAIANGEAITGVTTMLMDAGVDTGAMLRQGEMPITPEDNAETLSTKLAHLGANLLLDTLLHYREITPQPQDDRLATYAPLIKKADWQLDLTQPALTLHNRIRGFYPDAWLYLLGERVKIYRSTVVPSTGAIGTVTSLVKGQGFVLQTGDQGLLIQELQPENKKRQSGWDFANGTRLQQGMNLL